MSTSCKQYHLEPTYKQHTAVEDKNGVIVDVGITTGQANEGKQLLEQVERIETTVGAHVACVTCDAGYAHGTNYAALEERGTDAVIPTPRVASRKKALNASPHADSNTTNTKTASPAPTENTSNAWVKQRKKTDSTIAHVRVTARTAPFENAVFPPRRRHAQYCLLTDTPPCCARGVAKKKDGTTRPAKNTVAIGGKSKACTDAVKHNTVSRGQLAEDSPTSPSNPTSLPP